MSWLGGYKIHFNGQPIQPKEPKERCWSKSEKSIISKLLNELIIKGANEGCIAEKDQFLSNIFLRRKNNGSYRMILDLKKLNEYITTEHFKLEDGRIASKLISYKRFMASLDLKYAYYLVPIHKSSRKYLRFRFENKLYQFTCLLNFKAGFFQITIIRISVSPR